MQLGAEEILGGIQLTMKGWVDEFSKKGFLKSGSFGTTQKEEGCRSVIVLS